eukprot:21497-Heterococcus_DN1.PRE.1
MSAGSRPPATLQSNPPASRLPATAVVFLRCELQPQAPDGREPAAAALRCSAIAPSQRRCPRHHLPATIGLLAMLQHQARTSPCCAAACSGP